MPDLRTKPHRRSIPKELLADFDALGISYVPWGPEVCVTQQEVDVFTALSGDTNVIHTARPDVQTIVPGLMVASLLPRLLPGGLPLATPERTMVNLEFGIHFFRPVLVDTPMQMRYRPSTVEPTAYGPVVKFEFEIGTHVFQRIRVAARGDISILVQSA